MKCDLQFVRAHTLYMHVLYLPRDATVNSPGHRICSFSLFNQSQLIPTEHGKSSGHQQPSPPTVHVLSYATDIRGTKMKGIQPILSTRLSKLYCYSVVVRSMTSLAHTYQK